jgi:hypothetical protein
MKKKASRTSRPVKSVRNVPAKTVKAKTANRVKGGVSLAYGKVEVEYKPQKPDGTY